MSFLGRPWTRKPPSGPIRIDPNNPLTTGIVSCCPFVDGRGLAIDIANSSHFDDFLPGTWSSGPSGICASTWEFTNASTPDLAFSTVGNGFTVATVVKINTLGSNTQIIGRNTYASETVNTGWEVALSTANQYLFAVFNNNGFAIYDIISNKLATVGDHTIVMQSDQVTQRSMYIDGVFEIGGTVGLLPLASTGPLCDSATTRTQLYLYVIWARSLSAFEVAAFSANPWQIFAASNIGMAGAALQTAGVLPYNPWRQLAPILAQ